MPAMGFIYSELVENAGTLATKALLTPFLSDLRPRCSAPGGSVKNNGSRRIIGCVDQPRCVCAHSNNSTAASMVLTA
jgi:hypothetical protein